MGGLLTATQIGRLAFDADHMDGRSNVFNVLAEQIYWLVALDQGETLWQVHEAIREVDGWYGV